MGGKGARRAPETKSTKEQRKSNEEQRRAAGFASEFVLRDHADVVPALLRPGGHRREQELIGDDRSDQSTPRGDGDIKGREARPVMFVPYFADRGGDGGRGNAHHDPMLRPHAGCGCCPGSDAAPGHATEWGGFGTQVSFECRRREQQPSPSTKSVA